MKNIIIAPQDASDFLENEIDDFLYKILGFNPGECLVTDESSLRDFSGCGLPDDINDKIERHTDLLNLSETDRQKRFNNLRNAEDIYWIPYILEKIKATYDIEVNVNDYLIDIVRKIHSGTIH